MPNAHVMLLNNGRTMERSEPADWKEKRRMRAYELKKQGWKQTDIAEALGVTDGAVSQWMNRAEEGAKRLCVARLTQGRTSASPTKTDRSFRRF